MPTVHGVTFDRVIDAVADLGLDDTGATDIAPDLSSALSQAGTLVDFPPGTYHVASQVNVSTDRAGVRGLGDTRTDVTFTVPAGFSQYWLYFDWTTGVVVSNVSVEWGWDRAGGLVVVAHDDAYVGDYEIVGPKPQHSNGGIRGMYYDIVDAAGSGRLERYVATGPGEYPRDGQAYSAGLQGLLTDSYHEGKLTIRGCDQRNWTENGFYCSKATGVVDVANCYFENIDNAALRLASEGSRAENCVIVVDMANANPDNDWPDGPQNPRGMWFENLSGGAGTVDVLDCDVHYAATASELRSLAGIAYVDHDLQGVTFTNCRFHTNVDQDSLHFNTYIRSGGATFDGCHFTGAAAAPAVRADVPTDVVDACIDMPNGGGFSGDVTVSGTTTSGCTVARTSLTTDGGGGGGGGGSTSLDDFTDDELIAELRDRGVKVTLSDYTTDEIIAGLEARQLDAQQAVDLIIALGNDLENL